MTWAPVSGITNSALVVLDCNELDETLAFFVDRLGFRLEVISPADNPVMVVVFGFGLRLKLQVVSGRCTPSHVQLFCSDPASLFDGEVTLTAPNGTLVELVAADPVVVIPPVSQSLVVSTISGNAKWGTGRAGMQYRDLDLTAKVAASFHHISEFQMVARYPTMCTSTKCVSR